MAADITALQTVEVLDTSLPSADERYQLLIDAISDYAIYMLDPDGIVTSWNSGARRVKGYAAPEIVGSHFSKFYTEDDRRAGLPARALKTAEAEGKFESEGWRVRNDGSRFWAHVVIDPIRSPDGRLIGFAETTDAVTPDLIEAVHEAYLGDARVRFFLLDQNPAAVRAIAERFLAARRRGLWHPLRNSIDDDLAALIADAEAQKAPPPLTPPLKGEGDTGGGHSTTYGDAAAESPSPLQGGVGRRGSDKDTASEISTGGSRGAAE